MKSEGVAMGAHTSAVLAETLIRCIQHTKIIKILNEQHIIDYHTYVDDTLIIYNKHNKNTGNTLTVFNAIRPKIIFTIEKET
jgi:hypothetical protein